MGLSINYVRENDGETGWRNFYTKFPCVIFGQPIKHILELLKYLYRLV